MNLKPFTGAGSTPSRRRFWDQVTNSVLSSRKLSGREVNASEYQGKGTVLDMIDLTPASGRQRSGGTYPGPGKKPSGTSRCCLPDQSCEDMSEEDCMIAGGTFIPGGSCDDSACTCCTTIVPFTPCDDGVNPCTKEQACSGDSVCIGDTVDCGSLWLTAIEFCCNLDGSRGRTCCTSSWNPLTCELTQIGPCGGVGGCDCTGSGERGDAGTEVADPYIPCS